MSFVGTTWLYAQIDQYVAGRPPGGWLRWMLDKLDWADFVLLICTQAYYRRFRGHEGPDIGKGVDWEGQLITVEIYNSKSRETKFVPVIFESQDKEFIPEPLSDHFYSLDSEDRYQELYRILTGQAGVPLPELGPAIKIRKRNVKPLTFGNQSGKVRGGGKSDAGSSPSFAKPASGADSTARASGSSASSNEDTSNGERRKEIVLYALISLTSFLFGVGVLGLTIWKAELLTRLGLRGNLFYIVLLPMGLAHLSLLEGSATRDAAPGLHRGQKVCPTRAISVTLKNPYFLGSSMWARRFEEITAGDSTLKNRAAKRLGLSLATNSGNRSFI